MAPFINRLCNLMFPCLSVKISDDFNEYVVDQEAPRFDSDDASQNMLPDSVFRDILPNDLSDKGSDSFRASQMPVKSVTRCKGRYQVAEQLSDETDCVSDLPNSVIHEILLRLPLESIACCKRVCKGWSQLISDPYFRNVYFNKSPFNAIAISQHKSYRPLWFYTYHYVEIRKRCDMSTAPRNMEALFNPKPCEMSTPPINLEALFNSPVKGKSKEKRTWKTIIGSCDGLLSVTESAYPCENYSALHFRRIYRISDPNHIVWIVNPLTGEYILLPKANVANNVTMVYGFGSTVNGDQRKVIKLAVEKVGCVAEAHIFTIGVDEKWRDLDSSALCGQLYPHGLTALNGILHWVGLGAPGVIYAINIEEERGYCLLFPVEIGHWSDHFYLGVWDGHLCVTDNSNEFELNIWTMKQYGLVESWSRVIILRGSIPRYYSLIPITTMNNGHLVLNVEYHGRLISLDPKTNKIVEIENSADLDNAYFLFGYAYVPSFLTP